MIHKLAEIAKAEVGVREVGGNNNGERIRVYQSATDLTPSAWPWCAAFVDWCVQQWLVDEANTRWLGLKVMTPEGWRPKTALAFGLLAWAKERPRTVERFPDTATPRAGDIVVFDFSHCGIITGTSTTRIQTVEGNTNGKGERDSTSGDGVWAKDRSRSIAQAYLRIRPSGT